MLGLLFRLLFVAGLLYFIKQVVSAYKIVSTSIRGGRKRQPTGNRDQFGNHSGSRQTRAGQGQNHSKGNNDAGYAFSDDDVVDVPFKSVSKEDEFQEQK